jgi:hypothetical protein
MPIGLLKTSLKRLRPSRFFYAKNAENEFAWPFDYLKYRFTDITKVVFLKRLEGKL